MDIVSSTFARNNLSRLLDEVAEKGKSFILIRESKPAAALIPYEEMIKKEKEWQAEFKRLLSESQKSFKRYIKNQNKSQKDISEEKLYELIDKTAGRTG